MIGSGRVVGVDEVARRLYYLYFDPLDDAAAHLREYDLDKRIPQLIRDGRVFRREEFSTTTGVSAYTVTTDRARAQMLVLNNSSTEPGRPYKIQIINLKTFRSEPAIDLITTTPGFIPYGISYSPDDDRLYMVGDIHAYPLAYTFNPNGIYPLPITAVAAIDMKTRRLAWLRVVPQCQTPLITFSIGALVALSARQDALYFGCIRQGPYPGESGLIRLSILSDADMTAAQRFRVEFFPVSGLYTGGDGVIGIAAFDEATDRFYMQSASPSTPGAWVFDGGLSSWVGFVAAPDNFDAFIGFDQRTGRLYIGGEGEPGAQRPAYIVVSDGRATPVPQGNTFVLPGSMEDLVHVDPATRRLFVTVDRSAGQLDVLVLEDTSALAQPPRPIDYDSLTTDVDEGPNTASAYSGTINGFGSHVLLAGGYGGALSICGGTLNGGLCPAGLFAQAFGQDPTGLTSDNAIAGLKPGDRSVYAARVGSLDLRNVGASASAQALAPDSLTADEYETRIREPVSQGAGDAVATTGDEEAGEEVAKDVYDQLPWPHPAVACLDGGGRPLDEERSGAGGSSSISCDLKAQEADAMSRFSALAVGGISVASSFFEGRAFRDPKLGTVTESTAIAKGVEIQMPGGTVSIAEVAATARTVAHGRPKTAEATWERTLSGVVVRDSAGAVTYRCSDADSCDPRAAVAAMNEVLGVRIRVFLPEPEREATPKGAFAGVQRTDADYYNALTVNNDNSRAVPGLEIIVFNDSVEKSRLIVQLAGIQASSIYGISFLPEPGGDGGGPGGIIPPVPLPTGVLPTVFPGTFDPGASVAPPGGPVERLLRSALFFIRSPKDALLTGLLGLLFVGAAAAAWRRGALVRQLREP